MEEETKRTSMWTLFSTFARIGGFTFGGGMSMLPMLEREIVERYHWATEEELLDYFAVAQATPGIIAVNVATFIGKKERGILGGIIATFGVVAPSLVIILLIAALLTNFASLTWVKNAFAAIRACVCVLIFNSWRKLAKKTLKDWLTYVILGITCLGTLFLNVSPVLYVVVAGLVGALVMGKAAK